jgi:hypothetical protein
MLLDRCVFTRDLQATKFGAATLLPFLAPSTAFIYCLPIAADVRSQVQ